MRAFLALFLLAAECTHNCNARLLLKSGVGAVVSNGKECGPIGLNILNDGGNAVDAAIAVLLCEGVTGPQNMGIGGGFLATIYMKRKKQIEVINAREAAPQNSDANMFEGVDSIKGGRASAIPSEIKGYWEMKQRYGSNYPWQKLFEPAIKLCEEGYVVDSFLATVLEKYKEQILAEPSLKEVFVNPDTDDVYQEGEVAKRPQLGETLRNISINGASELYCGCTGKNLISDVKAMGGVLTMDDLRNYKVKLSKPVRNNISNDFTLYSVPLPGSGVVLSLIFDLLKNRIDGDETTRTHRIVEAFKHAYGYRSQLADTDFEPSVRDVLKKLDDCKFYAEILNKIVDSETFDDPNYYGGAFEEKDHGTANIAIIDKDGNAITATSTINNVFGAFVRSQRTGIILNDEMDDFSTPGVTNSYGLEPSKINFIKPGKRPMSSMCPTIILDKRGNVRLLIGASGGPKITTSIALTIIRHLFWEESLYDAINSPRIHHQLLPMQITVEENFDNEIVLDELREKKHEIENDTMTRGFNAVTGISIQDEVVTPVFDERRGGSAVTTQEL